MRIGNWVVAVTALIVVACSDDAAGPPVTAPLPTTTSIAPVDDGVLRLGVLLPAGGAGAELGQSLGDGVTLALTEINAAGGVGGQPVRRIIRSEGSDAVSTNTAMQSLVDSGVDAIIGPASSNGTLAALGTAVAAGRVVCSPTASAMALDDFPDNGLFFRTIPSDSLQARAIARVVDQTGTTEVAIAYIDDAYGSPFAAAVVAALEPLGIAVDTITGYTPEENDIATAVRTVAAAEPGVVVVIGDSATGPAMLNAIDLAVDDDVRYVVNDAMRRPASTVQPFTADLAPRITGVSPRSRATNIAFVESLLATNPRATGLYAANAYDCVNLIALAATFVGSTLPTEIARGIPIVAVNGSNCATYPTCADSLGTGRNVDYNGPNGDLTLGTDGERTSAVYEVFGFDDSGRDVTQGQLTIFR